MPGGGNWVLGKKEKNMALEFEYEDAAGVIHSKAYGRIQKVIIENLVGGQKNVSLDVSIYASQTARDAGKYPVWGPQGYQVQDPAAVQPVAKWGPQGYQVQDPAAVQPVAKKDEPTPEVVMECAVDPDTVTIADAYVWLKTQEKFKESKDV
jgi:hypothetical protein